jgi:hypothetical protein
MIKALRRIGLFVIHKKLKRRMQVEIIPNEKEKYLQINELEFDNNLDYHNFWRDIQSQYAGYKIDFCYHNCNVPTEFMKEIGAILLDSCIESRLQHDDFRPVYGKKEGMFVTDKTFNVFKSLHDKLSQGVYWTSERIGRDMSCWSIYVRDNSYVLMSLWGDTPDIYNLVATNADDGAILLSAVTEYAFEMGKNSILFMIDDDSPEHLEAARSIGFLTCGEYIAYRLSY